MNDTGMLSLLGIKIARLVFHQALGKNQDAVERGAQFVGHGRQEFGFVAATHFQLTGFFLQFLPRTFKSSIVAGDFFLLAIELAITFFQFLVHHPQLFLLPLQAFFGGTQNARLFFQFFIGGAQFFLLALEGIGLLLGLLQGPRQFCPRQRRIERYRHCFTTALKEFHILGSKRAKRQQFDNPQQTTIER